MGAPCRGFDSICSEMSVCRVVGLLVHAHVIPCYSYNCSLHSLNASSIFSDDFRRADALDVGQNLAAEAAAKKECAIVSDQI